MLLLVKDQRNEKSLKEREIDRSISKNWKAREFIISALGNHGNLCKFHRIYGALLDSVVSIKYDGICINSCNFPASILRIPALSNSLEFIDQSLSFQYQVEKYKTIEWPLIRYSGFMIQHK